MLYLYTSILLLADIVAIIRVLLRTYREPASRIAWIAIILLLPVIGVVAYTLLGEVNIGRKRIIRMQKIQDNMPSFSLALSKNQSYKMPKLSQQYEHLFELGKSISGFEPVGGNQARLMDSSAAMIDNLVADIDAAQRHVHLLFYIWLPDNSGIKVADALKRAVKRGVKCRAMVDSVGSSALIRSAHWQTMQDNGISLGEILPIGNPIRKIIRSRIDLRNHRKLVIIDGEITYCGSQNCVDAEFMAKPKFIPWVDAVLRLEGAVALQNQYLFANDWMICTGEDISDLLHLPFTVRKGGFTAQVIGTGPTDRHLAMSQMFVALIASARHELIITTPYYIPNAAIQSAVQAAAYRGVKTTLVFPQKNDSWILKYASHSYYAELLEAGVNIFEYTEGLLHAKTLTIDGEFMMMGSANLDRRSFDLNYENNMLICDKKIVAQVVSRQQSYIAKSLVISKLAVAKWSKTRRLLNNAMAMMGPIL